MKKTLLFAAAILTVSFTSCEKEYSCVCGQAGSEIVQAGSKGEADKTCDAKGADCEIQ